LTFEERKLKSDCICGDVVHGNARVERERTRSDWENNCENFINYPEEKTHYVKRQLFKIVWIYRKNRLDGNKDGYSKRC